MGQVIIHYIIFKSFMHIPTLLITTLLITLTSSTTSSPHSPSPQYPSQPPAYTLTKLSYTNLTKSQSASLHYCSTEHSDNNQLIPSINIHEGDSISYPAIVRYCDQFYTINGYHLLSFSACAARPDCRYFVSSVRNQFTYFAQVQHKQGELNSTVLVMKLQSRNKKVSIQKQATISVPAHYGQITGFANSFSLSLKLYAFSTNKNYLIFYRIDGTLQHSMNIDSSDMFAYPHHHQNQQEDKHSQLKIIKLNNHLAIYTAQLNKKSFIYTINTNGKNSTLKKYTIPKFETGGNQKMEIKFNDNHWNQFYVKIQNRIYVYDQNDKLSQVLPKLWYPMIQDTDEFHVAASMLIVVSNLGKQNTSHQPIKYYYNLSSNSVAQFFIPNLYCPQITHISTSSKGQGSQILCTFCKLSFQCYSMFANGDHNSNSKADYTDYSKFRVPLVLISLGVVIFISVTRGKKKDNKFQNEEKQEEMFMQELQKKDKTLYEQLKRNRKTPMAPTTKNSRAHETNTHEE